MPKPPRRMIAGTITLVGFILVGWLLLFHDPVPVTGSSPASPKNRPAAELRAGAGSTAQTDASLRRDPLQKTPTDDTASLLIRVWYGTGADREPAARFPVEVSPHSGGNAVFARISATTNAAGEARISGIRATTVLASTGRSLNWFKVVDVVANQTTEVDLEISSSLSVSGIVVDTQDVPIADAVIEAVRVAGANAPVEVGRSGADGRFRIRAVPEVGAISARAAGYYATHLHAVNGPGHKSSQVEVKLVLRGGAGAVRGTLVDELGKPIAKAVVRLGKPRERDMFHRVNFDTGGYGFLRSEVETRSDANGEFHLIGLAPGQQAMAIRAPNCAPWLGSCEITAGLENELTLILGPGAECKGVVLQADGKPAYGCRIRIDAAARFFQAEAMAGPDGSYHLTGLAPGQITLAAMQWHAPRGMARGQVLAGPGETVQWNPRLGGGIEFRGRVITTRGRALAKVSLQIIEDIGSKSGTMRMHTAQTDTNGKFVVQGVEPGPILYVTVLTGLAQAMIRPKVDAAAGECIIRVPDPGLPNASIRGLITTTTGQPPPRVSVHLIVHGNTKASIKPDQETGTFRFDKLLRSDYTVRVQAAGYITETRSKQLLEQERWDLGAITLERGGWVEVPLSGITQATRDKLSLIVRDATSASVARIDCTMTTARSLPLRPGEYRLDVGGAGLAAASLPLQVRSGNATRVRLPIEAGINCAIMVTLPRDAGTTKDVKLSITPQDGPSVLNRTLPPATGRLRPLRCCLAPGNYAILAVLKDGRTAERQLKVEAGSAVPVSVSVVFR